MAVVTFPHETAQRLRSRIDQLIAEHGAKVFPATDVAMGLFFTPEETHEFGGDTGEAMIFAAPTLKMITSTIPEFEGDRRNYCIIKNERAIVRIDPFAQSKP
ncbi:hypothetical protein [Yoonia maritima]|uniref:hypothetical protein n=1 Tax=Yoonia maritima TaxID=1435347 RepID=UPI000D10DAB9|nr:hypothetical protein [Yoonia maritima]